MWNINVTMITEASFMSVISKITHRHTSYWASHTLARAGTGSNGVSAERGTSRLRHRWHRLHIHVPGRILWFKFLFAETSQVQLSAKYIFIFMRVPTHVFDGDKEHIDKKIIYICICNTKPPVVVSRGYRWSGLLGAMVSATMMLPPRVVVA